MLKRVFERFCLSDVRLTLDSSKFKLRIRSDAPRHASTRSLRLHRNAAGIFFTGMLYRWARVCGCCAWVWRERGQFLYGCRRVTYWCVEASMRLFSLEQFLVWNQVSCEKCGGVLSHRNTIVRGCVYFFSISSIRGHLTLLKNSVNQKLNGPSKAVLSTLSQNQQTS